MQYFNQTFKISFFSEAGFHYLALAGQEPPIFTRLAFNTERSAFKLMRWKVFSSLFYFILFYHPEGLNPEFGAL